MQKLYVLLCVNCLCLSAFCQGPQEGDELVFHSKLDNQDFKLKVIENDPLNNNPMVHFHAQPLTLEFSQLPIVLAGAGVDVYLLKTLQVNADLKVAIFDLYRAAGGAGGFWHVDASVGVSYGFAFIGHHSEKVYLRDSYSGYSRVREFARAEDVKRGYHFGGRAGYSVFSGNNVLAYENITAHCIYLGLYLTRIRDFFVRRDDKGLGGRFGVQKVYADVLLPFATAGNVYTSNYIGGDSAIGKPTGFHPGFRIGFALLPPYIAVKRNGNLSKVGFYVNLETGLRPGIAFGPTYNFYASIGVGLSYMTFKPHFNGDNVSKPREHKKTQKSSPYN